MKQLVERIKAEAVYVGDGIVKVDSFLNHQVDPTLMSAIGTTFVERLAVMGATGISKVLTAEVSGIPPALNTALALAVPMVYARKHRSAAMTDQYYMAQAQSRTKGDLVQLRVSNRYLESSDRVLLIDDFLATGSTIDALINIIHQSGATLCGIGCVIEKPAEQGRKRFAHLDIPIVTLAKVDWCDDVIAYE